MKGMTGNRSGHFGLEAPSIYEERPGQLEQMYAAPQTTATLGDHFWAVSRPKKTKIKNQAPAKSDTASRISSSTPEAALSVPGQGRGGEVAIVERQAKRESDIEAEQRRHRIAKQKMVNHVRMVLIHAYRSPQKKIVAVDDLNTMTPLKLQRQTSDPLGTTDAPLQLKRATSAPQNMYSNTAPSPEGGSYRAPARRTAELTEKSLASLAVQLKCPQTGSSIEAFVRTGYSQPQNCFAVIIIHPAAGAGFAVQYSFSSTSKLTPSGTTVTILAGLHLEDNTSRVQELEFELHQFVSSALAGNILSGATAMDPAATVVDILEKGFALTNLRVGKIAPCLVRSPVASFSNSEHPLQTHVRKRLGHRNTAMRPLDLLKMRLSQENALVAVSGRSISAAAARACLLENEWNATRSRAAAQKLARRRSSQNTQRRSKYAPQLFGAQICSICMGDFDSPAHGLAISTCQHWVCFECWKGYLESKANDGSPFVQCPAHECGEVLDDASAAVCAHLSSHVRSRLDKWANESAVDHSRNAEFGASWCPKQGCENCVMTTAVQRSSLHRPETDSEDAAGFEFLPKPDNLMGFCACSIEPFCLQCKGPGHWPLSCRDSKTLDQIRVQNCEAVLAKQYLERYTKPCPKCTAPIERLSGCNHMICANCQTRFCWICGVEGGYGCGTSRCANGVNELRTAYADSRFGDGWIRKQADTTVKMVNGKYVYEDRKATVAEDAQLSIVRNGRLLARHRTALLHLRQSNRLDRRSLPGADLTRKLHTMVLELLFVSERYLDLILISLKRPALCAKLHTRYPPPPPPTPRCPATLPYSTGTFVFIELLHLAGGRTSRALFLSSPMRWSSFAKK
jgi:hypothetical protein